MAHTISIPTGDGSAFDLAVAETTAPSAPALIFVPSIYGNTEGLLATMERYASHGFLVVSIDPFWRVLPGPLPLDRQEEASQRRLPWTLEQGLADVRAALAYVEGLPNWNGTFAVVGYCFGGRLALNALTQLGADAAVTFHGTAMHLDLADADRITAPFSFHFGELDPVVPMEQVQAIQAALSGKDGAIYVYPGAQHSFAQQESPRYDPQAGPLSEARALALLERLKTK